MDHCEVVKRKINPRERANLISLLTFFYTGKLFSKAFKKDLKEDDLYEVLKSCRSKQCGDKLEKGFSVEKQEKIPTTVKVIWKCYGTIYLILGSIHLCFKLINSVMEPKAIGKLVSYFKPNQTALTIYDAIYYAGVMVGLQLLHCLYFQNYAIIVKQLAIQIRTSVCSLIYRKALRLTPTALSDISLGNIITIITKDVLQLEHSIWFLNDLWISLIQTLVICYLLYIKVGISSVIGIGLLLAAIPLQVYLGKHIKLMRLNISRKTDERLQRIQESLSTIRIIKMYTWEKFFRHKIDEARKREMKELMKSFYLKVLMTIITLLSSKLGFYALIMTYIWINESASAEVIFYIMKCFETLKHAIAHSVSMGMSRVAEISASLTRIDKVLRAEELSETFEEPTDNPRVHLKDVTVSIRDKRILQNITLSFQSGLTVVTGQLGCGKSSLIKVILKDYPVDEGIVDTIGRKSYASQDPWLFPSSIKQNIIFGEAYDEKRYQEVVRVCALKFDFDLLPRGDETIVADRGLNLSKGQQARINLARAVYKKSDIYLFDDSLTALDSQVQDFIFNECIRMFLKDKLCILVTHSAKHINYADKVIILDNGRVQFQGRDPNITADILAAIEDTQEDNADDYKDECDIIADETTKLLDSESNLKGKKRVYQETIKEGNVSADVYSKYFKFGGGIVLFSLVIIMYVGSQFTESYISKLLTNWVNIQQNITDLKDVNFSSFIGNTSVSTELTPINFITTAVSEYKDSTANITNTATTLVPYVNDTIVNIEDLKLKSDQTLKRYTMMIISFVVFELLKHYLILKFARNASVKLHRSMIDNIIHSVMSFFDNYFIGNILNRFSQDLSTVDERLPLILDRLVGALFSIGGIVILIAVVNWRFLMPSVIFVGILFSLRSFYMPAARSIKRLESSTRSPIVGHLNASMEGLTTIRASRAQKILTMEFDRHQDVYTSAHYTSFCIKRAFGFYMDLFSTLFLMIIVGRFLFFDIGTAAGDVGLAITQAASLSMITQRCLIVWTELENTMTSVERVLEYTGLERENSNGSKIEDWPSRGEINYINVSLTYTNTKERVLKNINFSVKSEQKIGIVGRTGAGKSSIISTLFRLYNYEGQIIVDGVDIKTLPLKYLRQHISIIPQDPIMFAGTVRSNIDPLKKHTDEEIWKTVHKIQLENIIPSLDLQITDNNSNFSTGQRQLICLARAIIRRNKIVVLDEATANMDPETDILIQKAIEDNFSGCTVFVIAHRLQSILDCHKVMIMDKGEIREFDSPLALMEDKTSLFSKMLNNSDLLHPT